MAELSYNSWWIADPDDANYPHAPTTRLIDLNTLEQNKDGFGWGVIDDPLIEENAFDEVMLGNMNEDGDLQASARQRNPDLVLRLVYRTNEAAGGMDKIIEDLQLLSDALNRRGVIACQLKGLDAVRYYDYFRSPITQLLRGQAGAMYTLAKWLTEAHGMPLRLNIKPYPRLARVDGSSQAIENDLGLRDVLITNPGNRRSECVLTVVPSSGSLCGYRYGIRSKGNLTEFRTLYHRGASSWTSLGSDTTLAALSDGIGDQAAICTFATTPERARRFRDTRTATDPTALEGTFKAYLRLRPTGGTTQGRYKVQLRYGFAALAYALESKEVVVLDYRDMDTANYIEVDLGLVHVPPGVTKLVMDVWAERVDGDVSLGFSEIVLEPADYHRSFVTVPGLRLGSWGRTFFAADELGGTGALKRDHYRLNANGELARIAPTNGIVLPAGTHSVTFDTMLREPNEAERKIGELRIVRDPGGSPVTVKTLALRSKKNRVFTHRERTIFFDVTAGEEAALTKWQFHVVYTDTTKTGRRIHVLDLTHRWQQAVTSADPVVIDSFDRRAYVENSGVPSWPIVHENEVPMLPPGDSVIIVTALDVFTNQGYLDIDEREPTPKVVRDRAGSVTADIYPRVTH